MKFCIVTKSTMGKKEKKFISLSEVDHKLQFINIIAVIKNITPIINNRVRKLNRIELHLLDETVSRPGFNVKLKLECEMLNHFLDVAKAGFIIQLNDMKVVKNEGEVYGEIEDEEEITLFKDNGHFQKWFPDEKSKSNTDNVRLKVLSMVKWKKAKLNDICVMQENHDEKTNSRGRTNSMVKSEASNINNKGHINDDTIGSNIRDNQRNETPIRSKREQSTPKNETTKRRKVGKSTSSLKEMESPSTNSSRTSFSSNSSKLTRHSDVSNLKSSSSSSLNETKTLNKSLSLSRIDISKISKIKKSKSMSKLNKSELHTNSDDSDISFNVRKATIGTKVMRENRSISSSPSRVTRSSDVSNLKSSSLASLNKSLTSRTLNKSLSLSRLKKSSLISRKVKSTSLLKLNKTRSLTKLNKSNISTSSESDFQNSGRLNRSSRASKEKKLTRTSDSEVNDSHSKNNLIINSKHEKENKKSKTEEMNCKASTKSDPKENEANSSEEKPCTNKNLKRTRQKSKVNESPNLDKTSSSCSSSSKTISSCSSLSKTKFRKSETDLNNKLEKDIYDVNSMRVENGDRLESDSPTRKRTRLFFRSKDSPYTSETQDSSTSCEASPKHGLKPRLLRKNPTLNSSDSTLSEISNFTTNKTSRQSLLRQKRGVSQIDKSSEVISVSTKKLKIDPTTDSNKSRDSSPTLRNDLCNPESEESTTKSVKSKAVSTQGKYRENEETKEKELSSSKQVIKTSQSVKSKAEKDNDHKVTSVDKDENKKTRQQTLNKSELNKDISNKNTRNSAKSDEIAVKNSTESGKYGVFETYLKPLTKKLNFISVYEITDISLCDLEDVYVPDKFDLQCKVISEFVLVEEGIQVIRVQDGTVSKCGTLKIPLGHSWDEVSKEILDNPIVEVESPYIDIIIFNYFRLDSPFKPGNYFRINNVMAVRFQLKNDPRKVKKSNKEYFFCVQGQDANSRRLISQQRNEVEQRITALPQKSTSLPVEKGTAEDVLNSSNFKTPSSPTVNSKINLSSNKKSQSKSISEDSSGQKPEKNELEINIDTEVVHSKRLPPAKEGSKSENAIKNSETCKENVDTHENHKDKVNSSDETMLGETPPLLREINEIMHEESALGIPFTATEDIHLKNTGSEVTFSQFCEGAKLKGHNFRTSTQDVEADVQKIDSSNEKSLPKGVLAANSEVIPPEDSSKMEPLVYCPSVSSGSSAVHASPDKEKTSKVTEDSQQCSASVISGGQVKTISQLESSNSESQQVINDISSDLSNSSSVKVLSSNSSVRIDLEVSGSKDVGNKNQSSTKVNKEQVEPAVSQVKKGIPINQQSKVSQSLKETSLLLDKVVESSIVNVSISGNDLNKESNDNIEVVSDKSSNASLLAVDSNKTIKLSSLNTNDNGDLSVQDLEQRLQLIPSRCFYKSPTPVPALILTELELDEIYDNEKSPIKYFSYCHNRNLQMLTLDVIEKIKNTNSLTLTVTFISISPAFTDSWKEKSIKARCPSCEKLYEVFNASNSKNPADTSASAAIAVGSHVVCPDSQCCNQILENPEFHFSVELKLQDGTPLTALLGGEHGRDVFGCSASEAMRVESAAGRVADILEKMSVRVRDKRPTKVVVKREDICDPKSGPLFITQVSV